MDSVQNKSLSKLNANAFFLAHALNVCVCVPLICSEVYLFLLLRGREVLYLTVIKII